MFYFRNILLSRFIEPEELLLRNFIVLFPLNWGWFIENELLYLRFKVDIINEWRWFRFNNILLSGFIPGVKRNFWFFIVNLPRNLLRNIDLEVLSLFFEIEVLNCWGWFVVNVVSLSGLIIPVKVNNWGFVVFFPDNWRGLVLNEFLNSGFIVYVLDVWRRFWDILDLLGLFIEVIEINSWLLEVVSEDNLLRNVVNKLLSWFAPIEVLNLRNWLRF